MNPAPDRPTIRAYARPVHAGRTTLWRAWVRVGDEKARPIGPPVRNRKVAVARAMLARLGLDAGGDS